VPTLKTLSGFTKKVPPKGSSYWQEVRTRAAELKADGCSGVPDFYLEACLEHDIHYRTHAWLDGSPVFKSEADARFRAVIQSRSWFGILSPMSWWRWAGVYLLGRKAWNH
jgi:hypothetical protein